MMSRERPSESHSDRLADDRLTGILEEMRPMLWSWLRHRCSDQEAADDILQDSLTLAWQHRHRVQDASSARAWLFRIVSRQRVSHVRREHGRRLVSADASEYLSERVYDAPCRPFEDWLLSVLAIEEALGQLPVGDRVVLLGHDLYGHSNAVIASHLGSEVDTVRKRVHRARRRARERMDLGAMDRFPAEHQD